MSNSTKLLKFVLLKNGLTQLDQVNYGQIGLKEHLLNSRTRSRVPRTTYDTKNRHYSKNAQVLQAHIFVFLMQFKKCLLLKCSKN